jgi:hypothetical protein
MVSVAQKSKDFNQKEKFLDPKTIKSFKKMKITDKKSDKKATGCRFLNLFL